MRPNSEIPRPIRENSIPIRKRVEDAFRNQSLDLSLLDPDLREVPAQVRKMRWLKSLGLSGTSFHNLPSWIGELKKELTILSALSAPGNSLPLALRKLKRLETLQVVNSGLTSIPCTGLRSWISSRSKSGRKQNSAYTSCVDTLTSTGEPISATQSSQRATRRAGNLAKFNALGTSSAIVRCIFPPSCLEHRTQRTFSTTTIGCLKRSGKPKAKSLNEFKLVLVGRGGVEDYAGTQTGHKRV